MPTPWARLGPLDGEPGSDFIFDFVVNKNGISNLAPSDFRRRYTAQYAAVPIALSDHVPQEFRSNGATTLTLQFTVSGDRQVSVEPSLAKLRKFMRKDKRTGEPPDLVLVMGKKQWTVRIDSMEHSPTLWNADTQEQRVKVSLNMHTVEWEK